MRRFMFLLAAASALMSGLSAFAEPPTSQPENPSVLEKLQEEAKAVSPLVSSSLAKSFLATVKDLPEPAPRKLYIDGKRQLYSSAAYAKLTEDERKKLTEIPEDDQMSLYYYTKYGTPLAYVRLLEVLGKAGVKDVKNFHILDYGYGSVGHLRLLANCGASCVGVDVDPFLLSLYSARKDQGKVRVNGKLVGRVKLVEGRWPADEKTKKAVGSEYDLIISKNTLKNGYLHPERPVDKRMLVDLGVSEDEFVQTLHDSLKPGGHLMIYNICPAPAPADKPYIPWADGRCPFSREKLESIGFKVLAYDVDDCKAVREMAHVFGWDAGERPMNLEKDLFAHYTLVQRIDDNRKNNDS